MPALSAYSTGEVSEHGIGANDFLEANTTCSTPISVSKPMQSLDPSRVWITRVFVIDAPFQTRLTSRVARERRGTLDVSGSRYSTLVCLPWKTAAASLRASRTDGNTQVHAYANCEPKMLMISIATTRNKRGTLILILL